MKKIALIAASVTLAVSAIAADKLVIKGSDTLGAKLVPQMAEQFKTTHSSISFEIAAEGSTTGIAAIVDGTADIGMSSRAAKTSEITSAQAKGVKMEPTIVAWDGMAVIVNENSPIDGLKLRQIGQIFTGDVEDWSAVGPLSGSISVYTRNTASGTYQDFKKLAMRKRDYAPSSQKMAGNEQIASEVAKNLLGIGYVGLAYTKAPGIKVLKIDGVVPTPKTINAKKYPLARPTFFYTNGKPTGLVAEFVDFALSAEGQEIVGKVGFIPTLVE